jgi:restriction system protein
MTVDARVFVFCRSRRGYGQKKDQEKEDRPYDDSCLHKPSFFERLVVKLLVSMGYGGSIVDAGQTIGRSGDDGIDGTIKEDKLGLDIVNIQAKKWENPVGRPDIQTFAGSLEGNRSKKGVFITTSKFTSDAQDYVKRIEKKIILIDGERLTQFMIDYGVGVTEETRYIINKIDEDFFNEE